MAGDGGQGAWLLENGSKAPAAVRAAAYLQRRLVKDAVV